MKGSWVYFPKSSRWRPGRLRHMSSQCHHVNLCSVHCLIIWTTETLTTLSSSAVCGVLAWHFARRFKFCCSDLGWPEHRMVFLPPLTFRWQHSFLWTPATNTTFSDHRSAAPQALQRKTEVTIKQQWFCSAKAADRANRCPAASVHGCVYVWAEKRATPQAKTLRVCSPEIPGDPCGSLGYTSHK